eukprot:SAG11_NODE_75_length_18024_cov_5.885356_16_plen_60_part_00
MCDWSTIAVMCIVRNCSRHEGDPLLERQVARLVGVDDAQDHAELDLGDRHPVGGEGSLQ